MRTTLSHRAGGIKTNRIERRRRRRKRRTENRQKRQQAKAFRAYQRRNKSGGVKRKWRRRKWSVWKEVTAAAA